MKKSRFLSFALALLLTVTSVAMVSCGDGGTGSDITLANDTTDAAGSDEKGSSDDTEDEGDDTATADTNEYGLLYEYFDDYITDSADEYIGMVGLGSSGSNVHFDKFKVAETNGTEMYSNDFETETELSSGVFTSTSGELSSWAIGTDATDEDNHQLTYTGSGDDKLFMGNTRWGAVRFNVYYMLDDEDAVAHYYFCVTDENNYYDLMIAYDTATVSQVANGTSSVLSSLPITSDIGEWVSALAYVKSTQIAIYIDGTEYFHIGGSDSLTLETGKFGIGQWQTQFYIDDFTITDIASGDVIYAEDFEGDTIDTIGEGGVEFGCRNGGSWTDTTNSNGDWVVTSVGIDGEDLGTSVLAYQGSTSSYGAAVVFGVSIPTDCEGYKITVSAYRYSGSSSSSEFTCIIWGWDSENDYIDYNYGGWSGCGGFQTITSGTKVNDEMSNTIGMTTGEWVTLEVYVYANVVYAYYNGTFIQCQWLD